MIRLMVVIAALVIGLAACDEPKSERDGKPKPKALSDTATVLPPGVREQWFVALDQAIKERLSVYKGRVRVERGFGGVVYAPISNLQVECHSVIGIRVILERGEEFTSDVGIRLIGFGPPLSTGKKATATTETGTGKRSRLQNLFGMPAPELGVGTYSPAASSLMDDLCRHLVDRLEAMRTRKTLTLTPLP